MKLLTKIAMLGLLGVALLPCSANADHRPLGQCFVTLTSLARKNSVAVHRQALEVLLAKAESGPVDGKAIIDLLSRVPELNKLYASSVGVFEEYSLREHTLMVFATYNELLPTLTRGLKVPKGVNLRKMLPLMIALHDIGKPVAVEEGDKGRQHEFTIPMLGPLMKDLGMTPAEIKLAEVLTENDNLGEMVKDRSKDKIPTIGPTPEQVLVAMRGDAKEAGMELRDFLQLQTFFYTCDAASYPRLRPKVFRQEGGSLIPVSPTYQRLVGLVNAE